MTRKIPLEIVIWALLTYIHKKAKTRLNCFLQFALWSNHTKCEHCFVTFWTRFDKYQTNLEDGTRLFSSIFSSQLSCGRAPGLPAAECWLFAASARAALRPVRAIAGAVAGQVHLLLLRRLSAEQHEENQQESLESFKYFIVKENTCVTIILWLVRCTLICEYY